MTNQDSEEGVSGAQQELPSEHDQEAATPGDSEEPADGSGLGVRPERGRHIRSAAGADADSPAEKPHDGGEQHYADDDTPIVNLDPQILALIQSNQHLHLPIQLPNAEAIAALREADPDGYRVWIRAVEKRVDHDMWMEKAPLLLPYRLARIGQAAAVVGLFVMAVVAVVALVYGEPWVAGIFGVLDFIGIVAAFNGGQGTREGDRSNRD